MKSFNWIAGECRGLEKKTAESIKENSVVILSLGQLLPKIGLVFMKCKLCMILALNTIILFSLMSGFVHLYFIMEILFKALPVLKLKMAISLTSLPPLG